MENKLSVLSRFSSKHVMSLLLVTMLGSACSGSSELQPAGETVINVADGQNAIAAGNMDAPILDEGTDEGASAPTDNTTVPVGGVDSIDSTQNPSNSNVDPAEPSSQEPMLATVTFNVTVPVYVSDALQVQLVSGEKRANASWVVDESWVVSDEFPAGVEHTVAIIFSDDNGAITLGRYESNITVDPSAGVAMSVGADEFDTQAFDSDSDGVSNLDELLAGKNPVGSDALAPVQFTVEMVPDKTIRFNWVASEGAEFYRVLENSDGVSGYIQVGDDLAATVLSYDHEVALHLKANARYIVQACNASECTDSQEQTVLDKLHEAAGFIQASKDDFPNAFPNVYFELTYFGSAATLSGDGNTMAVGISEKKYNSNQNLHYHQAVYVLERINGSWQKQAYLQPRESTVDTFFGYTMSLSEDGNTLAIGANSDRNNATGINGDVEDFTALRSGAAYVFTRVNGNWEEQAYIKAGNAEAGDRFGVSVSLSSNGNTLAIGANNEDSVATGIGGLQSDNSAQDSGAVYIYKREGDVWQHQTYIKASNAEAGDRFGSKVVLSKNGQVLAVSALGEASAATGINGDQNDNTALRSGAVYLFSDNSGGWVQQAYIKASNTNAEDSFGSSLALNTDGSVLAVGAVWEDSSATGINGSEVDANALDSGAVFMYTNNDDVWQKQAYIKSSNTDENDYFGGSVSLNASGDVLAVGSYNEGSSAVGINGEQNDNSGTNPGAVYVFTYGNEWQQKTYIKSATTDDSIRFGTFTSLSSSGESLTVSATGEDSGALYLY